MWVRRQRVCSTSCRISENRIAAQPDILKEVLPQTTDAIRSLASKLRPGEAIVSLFRTNGLYRCRMNPSPAKLFKPGK